MKQAENKKRRNKKVVTGTLAICLLAATAIGGTLAYLTDTEQITNHFSTGDLDIDIDEDEWDDDGDEEDDDDNGDGQDLVPGDVRYKNPTVTAHDGNSFMRVIMQIQDQNGELLDGKVDEGNFTCCTAIQALDALKDTYEDQDELDTLLAAIKQVKYAPNFWAVNHAGEDFIDNLLETIQTTFKSTDSYTFDDAVLDTIKAKEVALAPAAEKERLELILQTIYYDTAYDNSTELDENGERTHAIKKDTNYYIDDYSASTPPPNASAIPGGVTKPQINQNITGDVKMLAGTNATDFAIDITKSSTGLYVYNYINEDTDPDNIFEEGTKVTLFTDIVIPVEWNQNETLVLGKYQIILQAQAIQSANFEDDNPLGKYAWEKAFEALDFEIDNDTAMQNYDELGEQFDESFDFATLVQNP